ncbi:MAG: hypothetical protein BGO51_12400 [Rhodospirillales bacterium 69-11]|nr:MAG: hypothetical protein BGO51_12400 [Rhodospirillales bacterium 69-11]
MAHGEQSGHFDSCDCPSRPDAHANKSTPVPVSAPEVTRRMARPLPILGRAFLAGLLPLVAACTGPAPTPAPAVIFLPPPPTEPPPTAAPGTGAPLAGAPNGSADQGVGAAWPPPRSAVTRPPRPFLGSAPVAGTPAAAPGPATPAPAQRYTPRTLSPDASPAPLGPAVTY